MGGLTPNRSYPFPLAGESPAGHTQIQDLAIALDADVQGNTVRVTGGTITGPINSFASAAARDAALPSPVLGLGCFRSDTGWYEYWNGTIWQPYAGNLPALTLQFANSATNIATSPSGARFVLPVSDVVLDSHPGSYAVNMADGAVTLTYPGTYSVRGAFMSQGEVAGARTIGVDIGDLTRSVVPGMYTYSAPSPGFPYGRANISVSGSAKFPAGQVVALWHAGDASFGTLGSSLRLQMTGA